MADKVIVFDSGYSTLKGYYDKTWHKEPTAISYAPSFSVGIGETKTYNFEDGTYVVGQESLNEDSFTTTDFAFKYKFDPLILKNFRDKLNIKDEEVPTVRMSLALIDWVNKEEFQKRCSEFVVNGVTIRNNIQLVPQGVGAYYDYVENVNSSKHPSTAFVIEIGYNTINVMYFENGKPVKSKSKGYPSHGVSTIIRQFTAFLESKFSMKFSEQEALKIFTLNKFSYRGQDDSEIPEVIAKLKNQFVKTLFSSILVTDRKLVNLSEAVILAGGGVYLLESTEFPPNVKKVPKPYEYSNVRGMI